MKSHDGVKDVLTHLASPTLLYEELRRELARTRRNDTPLSGVKVVLNPSAVDGDSTALSAAEIGQREILVWAQTLQSETRSEDICARMGDAEFLLILIGYTGAPEIFIQRFIQQVENARRRDMKLASVPFPKFNISFRVSESGDSSLEFLNQLDLAKTYLDESTYLGKS